MDKFYKKTSVFLAKNGTIAKNDSELYEYAVKVIIHGIINIVITILIGILFGMLKECLCFFVSFFTFRKFTGGLHLAKYISCLISSIVLLIISLFTIRCLEQNTYKLPFLIALILANVFICFLAPIDNERKKLSSKEKKIYKYFSVALSLATLLIVLFFMHKNIILAYSFGLGVIAATILLILAFVKSKSILAWR